MSERDAAHKLRDCFRTGRLQGKYPLDGKRKCVALPVPRK